MAKAMFMILNSLILTWHTELLGASAPWRTETSNYLVNFANWKIVQDKNKKYISNSILTIHTHTHTHTHTQVHDTRSRAAAYTRCTG